jgi:hypothetical protein
MGWVWTALSANCPPNYVAVMDLSVRVNQRNEPRPDVVVIPSRTDVPWAVTVDLPTFTSKRDALFKEAD